MLGFMATFSLHPSDGFSLPEPNRPPSVRRLPGLSTAQKLAIAGSLVLLAGVFVPAFGGRPGESLLQLSGHLDLPLDAVIVIILAALSARLAWKDHCVLLWLTGTGCQLALLSTYLLWEPTPPVPVAVSVTGRPTLFCGPIQPSSGLLLGWWIMELGVFCLFIAAFVDDLPPVRHWRPMPPTADVQQFLPPRATS